MTTDRHLAFWHNAWRFEQGAGIEAPRTYAWRFEQGASIEASKTYGSNASEERLHELHAILHETNDDTIAFEHEYAFAGVVGSAGSPSVRGRRSPAVAKGRPQAA